MRPDAEAVRMVLNAQMGKAGAPMDGKDLHIGDFGWGVLPPAAPLSIATLTLAGMAMAFARDRSERVVVSFIGEGGSSLGEWHEAINLCAARRLPAIFCIENNQTALSTPVVMLDRLPDCHRTSGDSCQSLRIARITSFSKSGVRTTSDRLTTCRRSDEQ